MKLRTYQENSLQETRGNLAINYAAMLQLATGGGKTAIFTVITDRAYKKDNRVWIVVPRNELLKQASNHLRAVGVKHGQIKAGSNESRAYSVHVVSKDTLMRRIKAGKIKNWPDLMIFDEAHVCLDQQLQIKEVSPNSTKFIGVTATPERLDGRGLSEMYDNISYGPSLFELIEMGYLSPMKYFCPPIEGIDKLHRKGTEYDQKELQELLERRRVFGSAIEHYRKYADGKRCLAFCRDLKASEDMAKRFNASGYKFKAIDGKMSYSERENIIDQLRNGEIHGLTSCELITYGLDVPDVECIIMLRPTLSKALYFQMIGRGLRVAPNKKCCVILDHVNNLLEHGHPLEPQDWNFYGNEKRGKKKGIDANLKQCNECFAWYIGSKCDNCQSTNAVKNKDGLVEVEGRLVEIQDPVKLKDRPASERSELMTRKGQMIVDRDVAGLLEMAADLGNKPMWAYHSINDGGTIDLELIKEIAKAKGYQQSWINLTVKIQKDKDEKRNKK